jgi:hypothetical protein
VRSLPLLRSFASWCLLLAFPCLISCERKQTPAPKSPAAAVPAAPDPSPSPPPAKPFALEDYAELTQALQAQAASGTALTAEQAALTSEFFRGWGQHDGAAAVAFAQTVEESQITPSTLAVLDGWGLTDLPAAVRWVTTYETDGHEKAFYIAKLATGLSQKQWEHLPSLAQAWSGIDPTSAHQWLMQLPIHQQTTAALEQSFKAWIAKDATAASEFLATAPKGAARNTGIALLVQTIRTEDPAAAEKWQLELTPPAAKSP